MIRRRRDSDHLAEIVTPVGHTSSELVKCAVRPKVSEGISGNKSASHFPDAVDPRVSIHERGSGRPQRSNGVRRLCRQVSNKKGRERGERR
jgi:hypothetical protein